MLKNVQLLTGTYLFSFSLQLLKDVDFFCFSEIFGWINIISNKIRKINLIN